MIKQSKTCISIIKTKTGKLIMAGDRRASFHWGHAETMSRPKIAKRSGILLGATGSGSLCTLLVNVMEIPELIKDLDSYVFFRLRQAIFKLLINQGYTDKEKSLQIPPDLGIELVIGIHGHVYTINIDNPYDKEHFTQNGGLIQIDAVSVPYATGCGGPSALPILLAKKKERGYNIKEDLKIAMEIAAEISPGCDNSVDYISED